MKRLSLFLVFVLLFNSIIFALPTRAATVLHVGPGQQYNGTSSSVIQQALNAAKSGDTIYLHAATYNISGPIMMKSGITLRGDGVNKTIIYGASNVCNTYDKDAYVMCKNVSNCEIYGITFKSASTGTQDNGHGSYYRNCISIRESSNIRVHDCSAGKWIYLDFVKASKSSNVKMYNCDIVTGHAGGYFYQCNGVEAYDNRILVYTNAGLRGDGTTNQVFHHNTIWCEANSGQAAFEFQNNCNNTEMHHNLVYNFNYQKPEYRFVVQNYGNSVYGSVSFHDNVYWNSSGGVQVGTGSGNYANPSNRNVSYWEGQGYGCRRGSGGTTPTPTPPPSNVWYSGTNFSSQKTLGTGNTGTNVTIEFDVTPLYSNTSGVIGYADSSTTINAFSSMPIIVSMEANKYFYARNGGSYAKDANVSFSANNTYHVKIIANMTAKTYDVFITPPGGSQVQIANDYAFRTGSPATDDVGKVCLNSATTNSNDFKVTNHTVSTGSSTPVTFNPAADAFVRGGSYAGTNYGTSTTLEVKVDNNESYIRKSYLKFNFSSVSSVKSAKLRFYVASTEGNASTFKLYGTADESWSETGIKWNNAPAASTYIGSISISATGGVWYEIDVTNYVKNHLSDKVISFVLLNDGTYTAGNRTLINSREASSNKPQLVITP